MNSRVVEDWGREVPVSTETSGVTAVDGRPSRQPPGMEQRASATRPTPALPPAGPEQMVRVAPAGPEPDPSAPTPALPPIGGKTIPSRSPHRQDSYAKNFIAFQ
ncbi:hypothetical protein AMK19_08930 [Kitasatospora sp. CB01950]|nr:hypothetical protein AMK19_08930 [Kitasatospora sp. CB01950]